MAIGTNYKLLPSPTNVPNDVCQRRTPLLGCVPLLYEAQMSDGHYQLSDYLPLDGVCACLREIRLESSYCIWIVWLKSVQHLNNITWLKSVQHALTKADMNLGYISLNWVAIQSHKSSLCITTCTYLQDSQPQPIDLSNGPKTPFTC